MSNFYITTPIYYVNGEPHLGSAYTTLIADIFASYHRFFGNKTFFLTGLDEHGQKVKNAAKDKNLAPQEHCDILAKKWQATWQEFNISNNYFIRTTEKFHKEFVQQCLQELFDKGEIYSKEYSGLYCVSEEVFYKEEDLIDGKTPMGQEVQLISETNHFFKMSTYQQRSIDYINNNPEFIRPEIRKNEILGFLKQPLEDLCISRPKSRLEWGIEIPFDKDYVTYVWFDALLNYISALEVEPINGSKKLYEEFWPACIHLLGKDILTTHAVYWTTMLMALERPLPKGIFAHGWLVGGDGRKMSKSFGNVVNPFEVKEAVGIDAFRYFLLRDIPLGSDSRFSIDLITSRYNSDLANTLGNLLSRTLKLAEKFFNFCVPPSSTNLEETNTHITLAKKLPEIFTTAFEEFRPQDASLQIYEFLSATNKYLDTLAPWKKDEANIKNQAECIYTCLESLRLAGNLLLPLMPNKMTLLLQALGLSEEEIKTASIKNCVWGNLKPTSKLNQSEVLFPKILDEKK